MLGKLSIKRSESGAAAIVVTFILIIIISLIVSGTLLTVRRNEREALDRQQSTQAFYAAESGVNDAIKALKNGYPGYDGDSGTGNKTHCNPDLDATSPLSGSVNQLSSGVQYSCLLINTSPSSATYNVNTTVASDVDINTSTPITNLVFTWKADGIADTNQTWDGINTNNYPKFPSPNNWKNNGQQMIGILRANITNLDCSNWSNSCMRNGSTTSFGPFARTSLDNDNYTAYFYPNPPGGGPITVCGGGQLPTPFNGTAIYVDNTISSNNDLCQGQIMKASCGAITANACTMNVDVTNANSDSIKQTHSKHFHIRLSSIYTPSDVTIVALNGNNTLPLIGTQYIIDSTGKAQDILKRIQVRAAPTSTGLVTPIFAVQGASGICKSLQINPGIASFEDPAPVCTW